MGCFFFSFFSPSFLPSPPLFFLSHKSRGRRPVFFETRAEELNPLIIHATSMNRAAVSSSLYLPPPFSLFFLFFFFSFLLFPLS